MPILYNAVSLFMIWVTFGSAQASQLRVRGWPASHGALPGDHGTPGPVLGGRAAGLLRLGARVHGVAEGSGLLAFSCQGGKQIETSFPIWHDGGAKYSALLGEGEGMSNPAAHVNSVQPNIMCRVNDAQQRARVRINSQVVLRNHPHIFLQLT